MTMDQELHYFDISFRRTERGRWAWPGGPDMESVIRWLRENDGRLNMVLIMEMPGEVPNIPDKESIT